MAGPKAREVASVLLIRVRGKDDEFAVLVLGTGDKSMALSTDTSRSSRTASLPAYPGLTEVLTCTAPSYLRRKRGPEPLR